MKRYLAIICIVCLLVSVTPLTLVASAEGSADFVILSTTDMHGKCWDTNVLTDGTENNNMLRVATAVKSIRDTYGAGAVVTIDNGDLYQGTPVSSYQISQIDKGLSTDPPAMALCLAEIGYDASVIGNHEFNYSWQTMNSARDYLKSKGVSTICANLYYDGTDGKHTRGENVFTPYITKEVTTANGKVKIGILGLENTDCTRWDVPDNYPGVVFAHPENTSKSMAWEVNRYLPEMQADGCDFIIVSYHSGLGTATDQLVFGTNTENQIARILANCTGIDMIVAGHDHSSSYSNTEQLDKNGNKVLIVNGGGTALTQSVFTVDAQGKVSMKNSQNLSLSTYTSDAALKTKIQPYATAATTYVNQAAGTASGTWDTKTNFYLEQTDTIDLINRAQIAIGTKYMAQSYSTQAARDELYAATGLDHIDVDMSSTSVVVNGSYTVKAGDVSMKDIYKMYRYDNSLYLLALTGQQIKDILEFNATNHLKAKVSGGVVSFSTKGENFTNPVFGGLNFTYDMALDEGSRAVITGFANGKTFELDKTYIVGVNNYHLGNVGCGFGAYSTADSIWSQADDLGGGVVQDLIYEFIYDETAANGSVTAVKSNWSLSYSGPLDDPSLSGDILAQKTTALADGDKVLIYYTADGTVIGSAPYEGSTTKLAAVETTSSGDMIGTSNDAAVFTVEITDAASNQFALKTEAGYLTAGDTGNSLGFSETLTDCGKWYTVDVEGGVHIMNVGANYNGTYNQALEWYTGFTTYGVKDTAAYLFNFYELSTADPDNPCAAGHSWNSGEITTAPTCTAAGVMTYTCMVCSETKTEPIAATGHSWNSGEVTTAPTCTAAGVMTYTCSICSAAKTESIAATGHVDANEDGVCDICGASLAETEPTNPFADVKKKTYYYNAVLWAYGSGITTGTDAIHFSPDNNCTRGQVVTFLWRAKGCPEPASMQTDFVDLDKEASYYKAVLWAAEQRITDGVDETHFAPSASVTRAQFVTFLWRAEGRVKPVATSIKFVDLDKNAFYYKAVLWAVEYCITDGIDATHFAPNRTTTRAQVVTFLYRALA